MERLERQWWRLTEYGDHLVVLYDLEAAGDDEAERVYGLAGVVEQVSGRGVRRMTVHGQRAQTPVRRQPEGRVLVEHLRHAPRYCHRYLRAHSSTGPRRYYLAVQVHADVRFHVLGAVVQHLRTDTTKTNE